MPPNEDTTSNGSPAKAAFKSDETTVSVRRGKADSRKNPSNAHAREERAMKKIRGGETPHIFVMPGGEDPVGISKSPGIMTKEPEPPEPAKNNMKDESMVVDLESATAIWVDRMGGGGIIADVLQNMLNGNLAEGSTYYFRGDTLHELITMMLIDVDAFLEKALALAWELRNTTNVSTVDLQSISILFPLSVKHPYDPGLVHRMVTSLRADFDICKFVHQHLQERKCVLASESSQESKEIIWDRMMCFLSVLANEVLKVEEGASHYRFGPEAESKEEGISDEHKIERQDYRHMEFMKGARADGLDPRLVIPPAPSVERADDENLRITIVPGMVRLAAERLGMGMPRNFGPRMGGGGWITSEGEDKDAEVKAAKALYTRGVCANQMRQGGGQSAGSDSATCGNDDDSYRPSLSDDDESTDDPHCIGRGVDDIARDDEGGEGDVANDMEWGMVAREEGEIGREQEPGERGSDLGRVPRFSWTETNDIACTLVNFYKEYNSDEEKSAARSLSRLGRVQESYIARTNEERAGAEENGGATISAEPADFSRRS